MGKPSFAPPVDPPPDAPLIFVPVQDPPPDFAGPPEGAGGKPDGIPPVDLSNVPPENPPDFEAPPVGLPDFDM